MIAPGAGANDLQLLYSQAVGFHQKGDLDQAERLYQQVLRSAPSNAAVRNMLGVVHAQRGKNDQALQLIASALEISPHAPDVLVNYGNVLKSVGRLSEAVASYDKAIAVRPNHAGSWNGRGAALLSLRRFEDAIASFERALSLNPNSIDALFNRGRALEEMERFAPALASYDRALAFRPQDPEILYHRGNALLALENHEAALANYDKALAIMPDNIDLIFSKGIALSKLKRFAETLQCYEAVLKIKPDHAEALSNRGTALYDLGRFDDALADYERALAIKPDYAHALYNKAKVLCEIDHIREGFESFMRHAQLVYGSSRSPPQDPEMLLEHKLRHDQEQRDYLREAGDAFHIEGGARLSGATINGSNSIHEISEQWRIRRPQIVVVDNLLTEQALSQLRRFCLGSKIWRKTYHAGYLGAFPEHGFACPLLAQIAEELRASYPAIFGDHTLGYLWAFKYDNRLQGTAVHADEAAVNVNFWITPDDANLDREHGGLIIWDKAAPLDWDFDKFNGDNAATRQFLKDSDARSLTVPYRANRAIIFDSDLFHETDEMKFRDGYENRRINITLLYGRRGSQAS